MGYQTGRAERREIKQMVLRSLSPDREPRWIGKAEVRVDGATVHVRYCTRAAKFNINPTTLAADYELWICGTEEHWYLLPNSAVRAMHDHPSAYPDRRNPGYTVVSVNVHAHQAEYAAPGIALDLSSYFRRGLRTVGAVA